MMVKLNLPEFDFRIKSDQKNNFILDEVRKKYVALTPEEWVRQNFIKYLISYKNYPLSLISVESALKINRLCKRSDIIVYSRNRMPILIVECKAPSVKISQKTFDQVSLYNYNIKVNYLIITNGLNHFCCKIDHNKNTYSFLNLIPDYNELI